MRRLYRCTTTGNPTTPLPSFLAQEFPVYSLPQRLKPLSPILIGTAEAVAFQNMSARKLRQIFPDIFVVRVDEFCGIAFKDDMRVSQNYEVGIEFTIRSLR